MQFSSALRNAMGSSIGTTIGAAGTLVFRSGTAPGVGNALTGTQLSTLTAVTYSSTAGVVTIAATADPSAAASGTPGYGRFLSSGATAYIEGTAGVGTAAVLGTVTLTSTAISAVAITSGGSGYPASSSLPVVISGVVPTIPAVITATTSAGGVITGVVITYGGNGYGSAPTATVAPPFDFAFTTTISLGGTVTLSSGSITIGNA